MIHNFNADGADSLYPKCRGAGLRRSLCRNGGEMKKVAKSKPVEHGLPFSTWSLASATLPGQTATPTIHAYAVSSTGHVA
jgi:hypothetical protein